MLLLEVPAVEVWRRAFRSATTTASPLPMITGSAPSRCNLGPGYQGLEADDPTATKKRTAESSQLFPPQICTLAYSVYGLGYSGFTSKF